MDRIRGVAGDPIFFELIENSVIEDIVEEGFKLDGPHVLDWRYPPKMKPKADDVRQQLANPAEIGVVKLAILRNPPKGVFVAAEAAAGPQIYVLYESDGPKVTMKSEAMQRLEDGGQISNAGYLSNVDDPRFSRIMENLGDLHSLDIPLEVVELIAARVPKTQVQSKHYLNMTRIRNEMIKAQTLAGFGNQVSREDARALLPPLVPAAWDAVDAVFGRNLDACLTVISDLDEELCEAAIYGLADEFVLLNRVQDAYSRFSGADDIVRDLTAKPEVFGFRDEDVKVEVPKIHRFRVQKNLRRIWDWKRSAVAALGLCEEAVVNTRSHSSDSKRYHLCKLCYDLCELPK